MLRSKKKKDKTGRKLDKGGNVGEVLRKTEDLSLRDTSNYVLWEYSVSITAGRKAIVLFCDHAGGTSTNHTKFRDGKRAR